MANDNINKTIKIVKINNKFSWVNTRIPGLRKCPSTYHRYFDVPPIAFPKLQDLSNVRSPTGSYSVFDKCGIDHEILYIKNNNNKDIKQQQQQQQDEEKEIEDNEEVLQLYKYYCDSQDCIIWYLCFSNNTVYYTFSDLQEFNLCAYSREEFDTRIVIEASLWYSCGKSAYNEISPKKIMAEKNKLNINEALYVEYYLSKPLKELNEIPPWD